MRKTLSENYIVAMDPHYPHNATPFGVWTWVFAPDGTEVEKFWYGTGNNIISLRPATGEARRIEIHEKQVADISWTLTASLRKWKLMKSGSRREILVDALEDVRKNRRFDGDPLDRLGRWWARGTALEAQLDHAVTLESGGRITCATMRKGFEKKGLKLRLDIRKAASKLPGWRYPESMLTNSARKWLSRLERDGLHWYVDGESFVITDEAQKAVSHYEKALSAK